MVLSDSTEGQAGQLRDGLGPEYRLSPERQARAEDLLDRKEQLTPAERDELAALVQESDTIMLRRARALKRLGLAASDNSG